MHLEGSVIVWQTFESVDLRVLVKIKFCSWKSFCSKLYIIMRKMREMDTFVNIKRECHCISQWLSQGLAVAFTTCLQLSSFTQTYKIYFKVPEQSYYKTSLSNFVRKYVCSWQFLLYIFKKTIEQLVMYWEMTFKI